MLIVNKPAGINIHSVGNNEICLKDYVEYYFFKKKLNCSSQPIHRLDKDTSGLVIFSKSEIFQPLFDQLVKNKVSA
uniref:pseudouridine synthase n=1 Tax=Enterocloster clostridioformis TaxID=1531 RepID=UPI003FA4A4AE